MATFEELKMAQQTLQNFEGLRTDIRGNAQDYLNRIARGHPLATIVDVVKQNTSEYRRRLNWARAVNDDAGRRARLLSGVRAMTGLSATAATAELTGLYAALDAAVAGEESRVGGITTAADVEAHANATRAALADHDSVW